MEKSEYYVYIYLDPRRPGKFCYEGLNISFLYEPFYVGKGKGVRMFSHLKDRHKSFKRNKIKAINNLKLIPIIFKLFENLNEKEAFLKESELIETIGRVCENRGPLTNMINFIFNDFCGGKTYKEIYGENWQIEIEKRKANLNRQLSLRIQRNKGKTNEQIYGHKKAEELKEQFLKNKKKCIDSNGGFGLFKNKHHTDEAKKKIGTANSIKQKGNLNSQYGTCWIMNEHKNKKIKKEELKKYIELGWVKGRKFCKKYESLLSNNRNRR